MRVKIWATSEEGEHRYAELEEAIPGDEGLRAHAEEELRATGRVWIGGGAAPEFLLTRIGPVPRARQQVGLGEE